MTIDAKREQLKNLAFKLVSKHPYSVVRTNLDRIGRQLRELDEKVRLGKSKVEKAE